MGNKLNKVLLAHAFFLKNDEKQLQEKFKPYPPIATLYAASLLRSNGHQVALFDGMLATSLTGFENKFHQLNPDILLICEDNFNFLSKMCLSHVRETTKEMITFAKGFGVTVIVNSSDATDAPDIYLDFGADHVISGEIEVSLMKLIDYLQSQDTTNQVLPPAVFNKNKKNEISGKVTKRKTLRDLDQLPQPAWDLVDFSRYRQAWTEYHGHYGINMVTTRGCPYRCNWCAKPIWGQQYVSHSPEYIVEQLSYLVATAQPDHIWFADDIFGLRKGWIAEYAKLLKLKNICIPYMIQSRADLISQSVVDALLESGCNEVWLGVESGSQKILDNMDKDLRLSAVQQARRLLKTANIKTGFFIQLGYLGEDIDELNATRDLIMTLLPDVIGVSVSYPLPGTAFFEKIKNHILDKNHWQESNDLEIVFNATFSSHYYRQIRNHLHQELTALVNKTSIKSTLLWQNRWSQLMATADSHRQNIPITLKAVNYGS